MIAVLHGIGQFGDYSVRVIWKVHSAKVWNKKVLDGWVSHQWLPARVGCTGSTERLPNTSVGLPTTRTSRISSTTLVAERPCSRALAEWHWSDARCINTALERCKVHQRGGSQVTPGFDMTLAEWHYQNLEGGTDGPCNLKVLNDLFTKGDIDLTTSVFCEQIVSWSQIGFVDGLVAAIMSQII